MTIRRLLWFSHKINKKTWRIYIVDPEYERDIWKGKNACWGMCLYNYCDILISAEAPKKLWSSILLHEIAHAQCQDLSEATVLNVENRLISVLLPHWKPPPYPKDIDKMILRIRRRTRRRKCRVQKA